MQLIHPHYRLISNRNFNIYPIIVSILYQPQNPDIAHHYCSVCVCAQVYVCMCACISVCMHACLQACLCISSTCVSVFVCVVGCAGLQLIYLYSQFGMFVCTCVHVYQSNCSLILIFTIKKTDRRSKCIPWLTRNYIYKVQIPSPK